MNPVTTTRRGRCIVLALLAVLVLAVAACGGAQPTQTPVPSGPIELAGTKWLLIKYLSPDGATFTVPAAITPMAEFTADVMSGNAGCNTFSGGYVIDGDKLTLEPMSSTMKLCEEPIASVENAYLAALGVVDKVAYLDNGNLQLWDSEGKTTLMFLKGN
ncbi:MAG TPA: META domain-containing protein [Candidatus Limnocylindrales bacterium]|nr:META domain-containing protein [Candidatus Limnocylindrales bacterium]